MQKEVDLREEINCLRLLAKCEFQMRDEGTATHSTLWTLKFEAYLDALSRKVETLRRLRTEGVKLQFSKNLDHMVSRIESMRRKVLIDQPIDRTVSSLYDSHGEELLHGSESREVFQQLPRNVSLVRTCPIAGGSQGLSEKAAIFQTGGYTKEQERTETKPNHRAALNRRRRRRRRAQARAKGGSLAARLQDEKTRQEELQREILELTEELKSLQMQVSQFFIKDRETLDTVTRKVSSLQNLNMHE